MATRAVQTVITYRAWDTSANAPKTGDVANHTLKWVKDGTSSSTTNAAAEVDSTNAKGIYKVTMTSTETDCLMGTLAGVSSTANVALFGPEISFEYIPNVAAGATGGLPLGVDSSGRVDVLKVNGTSQTAGDIAGKTNSLTFTVANQVDSNVIDWKSATAPAMTGDAFARLGAPSGASVSVDIAAINTKTTNLPGSPAAVGSAMTLTTSERTSVADALLDRDMSVGTDSGSTTVRTARQALRFLRNAWSISGSVLTVKKEDDSTTSWTAATTQTAGNPVSAIDPAGP